MVREWVKVRERKTKKAKEKQKERKKYKRIKRRKNKKKQKHSPLLISNQFTSSTELWPIIDVSTDDSWLHQCQLTIIITTAICFLCDFYQFWFLIFAFQNLCLCLHIFLPFLPPMCFKASYHFFSPSDSPLIHLQSSGSADIMIISDEQTCMHNIDNPKLSHTYYSRNFHKDS